MNDQQEKIEQLIERSAKAPLAGDAMQFAQAALNAAHAAQVMFAIDTATDAK